MMHMASGMQRNSGMNEKNECLILMLRVKILIYRQSESRVGVSCLNIHTLTSTQNNLIRFLKSPDFIV